MLSTEMNAKDAMLKLEELDSPEGVAAFIEGDERKSIIDAAAQRSLKLQGTKQGKQAGPITKKTSDFKGGIEGTKGYVTCEDVLKKMRAEGKGI